MKQISKDGEIVYSEWDNRKIYPFPVRVSGSESVIDTVNGRIHLDGTTVRYTVEFASGSQCLAPGRKTFEPRRRR